MGQGRPGDGGHKDFPSLCGIAPALPSAGCLGLAGEPSGDLCEQGFPVVTLIRQRTKRFAEPAETAFPAFGHSAIRSVPNVSPAAQYHKTHSRRKCCGRTDQKTTQSFRFPEKNRTPYLLSPASARRKNPPVAKMTAPIGTAIFAEWRMQVYKEGEENSLKKGFQRFCTSWIFASRCRLFSTGAYTPIMASRLGTHSTVKIMPGRKLLLKLCFHTRL